MGREFFSVLQIWFVKFSTDENVLLSCVEDQEQTQTTEHTTTSAFLPRSSPLPLLVLLLLHRSLSLLLSSDRPPICTPFGAGQHVHEERGPEPGLRWVFFQGEAGDQ